MNESLVYCPLVAGYGAKPPAFERIIRSCRRLIGQSALGTFFAPYRMEQIHATLLGLEVGELPPTAADYGALDALLQSARTLPRFCVRIGGYPPADRSIVSRGQSAYERSFVLDLNRGKVVIIGWICAQDDPKAYTRLGQLRQGLERAAMTEHKYGRDNDFYMTIGELDVAALAQIMDEGTRVAAAQSLAATTRSALAFDIAPMEWTITSAELSIVRSADPRLPRAASHQFAVANPTVTAENVLCGLG